MAQKRSPTTFQRARTQDQKEARRLRILQAGRAHLTEVGFERFSLGSLAKAAGVARATLYLYFSTREELIYALHLEALEAWKVAFLHRLTPSMSIDAYLAAYFDAAACTPLILETLPRVPGVLERNISPTTLTQGKRVNRAAGVAFVTHSEQILGVSADTALGIARGLLALLVGTTQALARPSVDLEALPDDVQEELAAMNPREAFLEAGRWLLLGAGAPPEPG